MAHTKAEMFEVLMLASKFQNEFVDLPFAANDIPDATLATLSIALTALDKPQAHFSCHPFGFVLRDFANAQVPVVVEAIKAAAQPAPKSTPAATTDKSAEKTTDKSAEPTE